MQVHKYLPTIYSDNLEMQSIASTEEKEFEDELKPSIDNSFQDTFIVTATEEGVERYEEIFSIVPDVNTEDLEFRKERILNRLVSQIPFTEEYLKQKLDVIIGPGQWNYNINYNNYTLDIYITTPGRSWLNELKHLCESIIPCNIDWEIHIYAATWQAVKEHFPTWQDVMNRCSTWQDVMDGEWLND